MDHIMIGIANVSYVAVWLVVSLMILRLLFRQCSKRFITALWEIIGIRLLIFTRIESRLSLIPELTRSTENVNELIDAASIYLPKKSSFPIIVIVLWTVGTVSVLTYFIIEYLRLYKTVSVSIPVTDKIFLCDDIKTPFVFGIMNPKIYLPGAVDIRDIQFVVDHESMHILCRDHIKKILASVILSLYWFHPFVWAAYILYNRDMECACDERVVLNKDVRQRKEYAMLLLKYSLKDKLFAGNVTGFGGKSIKERVKAIGNSGRSKLSSAAFVLAGITIIVAFYTQKPTVEYISYQSTPVEEATSEYCIITATDYTMTYDIIRENTRETGWSDEEVALLAKELYMQHNDLGFLKHTSKVSVNEAGQTYGCDYMHPDLVAIRASNGKDGYSYYDEVDALCDGDVINVYAPDGKTVIGEFIAGR